MSYVCAYSSVQLDKRRVEKEFTLILVKLTQLIDKRERANGDDFASSSVSVRSLCGLHTVSLAEGQIG